MSENENENESENDISAWNALRISASPRCMLQSNAGLLILHGITFSTNGMLHIQHGTQQLALSLLLLSDYSLKTLQSRNWSKRKRRHCPKIRYT